jgi:hypothetical protein
MVAKDFMWLLLALMMTLTKVARAAELRLLPKLLPIEVPAPWGFQPHALTDFTWTTSLLNIHAKNNSSACNDYNSCED